MERILHGVLGVFAVAVILTIVYFLALFIIVAFASFLVWEWLLTWYTVGTLARFTVGAGVVTAIYLASRDWNGLIETMNEKD